MSYMVKEVFHTLQGEGANTGRAAVFLRFAGCNLWSGRAEDRHKGLGACAAWCDTDFVGTDGEGGGRFESAQALAQHVALTWRGGSGRQLVVCTGGEPLLQLDAPLTSALHGVGFEVAVETNGTLPLPAGIDWICVSPKQGGNLVVRSGHELKLVVPQDGMHPRDFEGLDFTHFFLQPKHDQNLAHNTRFAVEYCMSNTQWRLSTQTHKILCIK